MLASRVAADIWSQHGFDRPLRTARKARLITGAARGIGAALAERLASHGARLALVGLEPERMAELATRCGEGTFVAECDVSNGDHVTQAVDAAAEALGGLDVVVANAGIATGGPLRSQDLRSWERVIEINLLGVMYTDRAALPHLERTRGYVLNIASTAAVLRGPGMSAYCAAKAGVEGVSDCLRIEMQSLGNVGVGVAYFLFLDTDMVNDSERDIPAAAARKGRDAARALSHLPAAPGDRRGRGRDRGAPPEGRIPTLVHEDDSAAPGVRFPDGRAPDGESRARRDPRVRAAPSPSAARAPRRPPSARASSPACNETNAQLDQMESNSRWSKGSSQHAEIRRPSTVS